MKNLGREDTKKVSKKILVFYIVAVFSCIIAIILAVATLVNGTDNMGPTVTPTPNVDKEQATEEELLEEKKEALLADLDTVYENTLTVHSLNVDVEKEYEGKDIIYTVASEKQSETEVYEVEIDVPYINVNNEDIKEINNKIISTYVDLAKNVIENKLAMRLQLKYQATIQNDILSLIIHTELKEGLEPQRLLIETINIDLTNNKVLTLEEYIASKEELNKEELQAMVYEEIAKEEKEDEILREAGYTIYERDLEHELYEIEKTTFFFLNKDTLYILYPYGNIENTRKTDVVVVF